MNMAHGSVYRELVNFIYFYSMQRNKYGGSIVYISKSKCIFNIQKTLKFRLFSFLNWKENSEI